VALAHGAGRAHRRAGGAVAGVDAGGRPVTTREADEVHEVNVRYHDAAAASYDGKWGVDICRSANHRRSAFGQ